MHRNPNGVKYGLMEYSVVKAVISAEFREHQAEKYLTVNFPYGDDAGELSMLDAVDYCFKMADEKLCTKCEAILKLMNKDYLFIELKIQR